MKTTQIVERPFLDGHVKQNHKTSYLNLNDLETWGNLHRKRQGLNVKKISDFLAKENGQWRRKETAEFIRALAIEEDIPEEDIVIIKKGKYGGRWAHPILFIKIAMWINPKFEVKIIKWFRDNLLEYRDNSGDSFRRMNDALTQYCGVNDPQDYRKIAQYVAKKCGVCWKPGDKAGERWNRATEEQLKKRDLIHKYVEKLAPQCPNDPVKAIRLAAEWADMDLAQEKERKVK
jgi:hypothetical protein